MIIMNNLVYSIVISAVVYVITIAIISYLTNRVDAPHIKKIAIGIYSILSLVFFSAIKFIVLSVITVLITYLILVF